MIGPQPAVSVIVPMLNAMRTLPALLAALAAQRPLSGAAAEYLIVDNGSTDGSRELAQGAAIPGLRVLQENERGPSAARNLGMHEARGEVLALLDADCVPARNWLREIAAPFADPEINIVAGGLASFPPRTAAQRFAARYGLNVARRPLETRELPFANTRNMAVRRSVALAVGGWPQELKAGEDVEFSFRVRDMFGPRIELIEAALAFHQDRESDAELWAQARQYGSAMAHLYARHADFLDLEPALSRPARLSQRPAAIECDGSFDSAAAGADRLRHSRVRCLPGHVGPQLLARVRRGTAGRERVSAPRSSGPPSVSVVIPVRDAAGTLGDCLSALFAQSLARSDYEVLVVVDERNRDASAEIAASSGATVLRSSSRGSGRAAGSSRNAGIRSAQGTWIAFTDADCVPSRGWLRALLGAVAETTTAAHPALGAAGMTIGYRSTTAAARFVDASGGLRADRHLAHKRYPWAPTSNAMYRRQALLEVGGFDARFDSYEGADLHTRLLRAVGGAFPFAPRAVVHHRHRQSWRAYWAQQVSYGKGYAQFFRRYEDELEWGPLDELRNWLALGPVGLGALLRPMGDEGLVRRGTFVKRVAQRLGFARTFWSPSEIERWRAADAQLPSAR